MEVTIQTDTKATIKGFLQKRLGAGVHFTDEDDIFKLGLVNSLFALELVVFLENKFNIQVENKDLDLANFSSLNNLELFIQKKKNPQ
jgi:methoxymalonate biosynthesis acyl carrier protein